MPVARGACGYWQAVETIIARVRVDEGVLRVDVTSSGMPRWVVGNRAVWLEHEVGAQFSKLHSTVDGRPRHPVMVTVGAPGVVSEMIQERLTH